MNTSAVPLVPSSPMSRLASTSEIPIELPNPKVTCDIISSPSPVVVMRTSHSNAGVPLDCYGFPHDFAQFISYSNISATHRAFITPLDSVTLPKSWQVAKEDPKWKAAMHEELGALETKLGRLYHYHQEITSIRCKKCIPSWRVDGSVHGYPPKFWYNSNIGQGLQTKEVTLWTEAVSLSLV